MCIRDRAKAEFNGCPVKIVLLLSRPTIVIAALPANTEMLEYPAKGITVSMDISQLLHILKGSGSAKQLNKTFDFCGKFLSVTSPKPVEKAGVRRMVSEAAFVDANGGKVLVSLWDSATRALDSLPAGAGVAVVGCSATVVDNEVKLNMWPNVHICTTGTQAQSLTSLDVSTLPVQTLTATFAPGQDVLATMELSLIHI